MHVVGLCNRHMMYAYCSYICTLVIDRKVMMVKWALFRSHPLCLVSNPLFICGSILTVERERKETRNLNH